MGGGRPVLRHPGAEGARLARGVLAAFTEPCRTLEAFDRNRQLLIDVGFDAAALPDARRLGRHDLLADQ
ncbi:hypothetical protein AB0H37_34985 [Actinomadura sp. NPDC023710]|uniref:hypothetical protein n=1 Tax=Actinomadura sp. NPDC023710 TaxID=3158219 RepID=UPI0033E0B413